MHWIRRSLLCLPLLCSAFSVSSALAAPTLAELAAQFQTSPDFRVRVAAALQLGKCLTSETTEVLEAGLDDGNASVRAAVAAALKNLGDQAALAVLKAHRSDKSQAVRAAVSSAIQSLEEERTTGPKTKLLVEIGIMKNVSGVKAKNIESDLAESSRRKLSELRGVRVLPGDGSSRPSSLPIVMVTGNVSELKASREGGSIVYSARVEYVVHTMPEQSIAAKVSGHASATASEQDAGNAVKLAALRNSVLQAAIASALRRAPPALIAAARL